MVSTTIKSTKKLLRYAEGSGTKLSSYSRVRGTLPFILGALMLGTAAYMVGRSPPRNVQIEYKEEHVKMPLVQTFGYDPKNFSRLEFALQQGEVVSYYPSTAVKKWDGTKYTERSRQTTEMYSAPSLANVTMRMYFPKEPQQVLIAGKDYGTQVRKAGKEFKVALPLNTIVPEQKDKRLAGDQNLEVLVYYKTKDSAKVTADGGAPEHLEDAERYVVTLMK